MKNMNDKYNFLRNLRLLKETMIASSGTRAYVLKKLSKRKVIKTSDNESLRKTPTEGIPPIGLDP